MVLAPCSLERTAPRASPVVELRRLTVIMATTTKTARQNQVKTLAAGEQVRLGDVDADAVVLEELSAEDEVLDQETEGEGDQGHVEVAHPDHEEAEHEPERQRHDAPHARWPVDRPAVVDGQDGHGESAGPSEGGLAEPDHAALAGDQGVGEEDDPVADALGHEPEPEAVHDEGQQADQRQSRSPGPASSGPGGRRTPAVCDSAPPLRADGSVQGPPDPQPTRRPRRRES